MHFHLSLCCFITMMNGFEFYENKSKEGNIKKKIKNVKENERFRLMKPDQPPWIHQIRERDEQKDLQNETEEIGTKELNEDDISR